MSRFHGIFIGLSLSTVGLMMLTGDGRAQMKTGTDSSPGAAAPSATLKVPWLESSSTTATTPAAVGQNPGAADLFKAIPPYQEPPDPNKDIHVTAAQGPWMICVHWYSGPDAHQMARKMVMELRSNPAYQLQAFVFNRGAEERRKEYERVKALVEKQREFFLKNNLTSNAPLRYKVQHIEDQCAILVGNYPDPDTARRDLDRIRRLKPPDPKRVDLATIFKAEPDAAGKLTKGEHVFINPFEGAFVVHNPLLKLERPAEWKQEEAAFLRKINQNEEFSLLACKKPYTLMVKQFLLPTAMQSSVSSREANSSPGSRFLQKIGLASSSGSDNAALNAHNMAKLFRQFQLDGYALHTRYSSIVTVGGFDSRDDPNLTATQEMLVNRFKIPQAVPIEVPR
jgi:hypothetical protein